MPLPLELLREVTREEVMDLPVRRYEGEVVIVETPKDLDRAWEDLAREDLVGWDTETRPAFRPGESYLPSLVQAVVEWARAGKRFISPVCSYVRIVMDRSPETYKDVRKT